MMKRNHKRINRIISFVLSLLTLASISITSVNATDELITETDIASIAFETVVATDTQSDTTVEPYRSFRPEVGSRAVVMGDTLLYSSTMVFDLPLDLDMYILEEVPVGTKYTYYRVYIPRYPDTSDNVYYIKVTNKASADRESDLMVYPGEGYYLGDLDGDERLSVFDIVLMRRNLIDPSGMSEKEKALSDLNGDNTYGVADLVLMQKFILAEVDHFYPDNFKDLIGA